MKPQLALLPALLCGLVFAGCGGSGGNPKSFRAYRDGDDVSISHFGHLASASEREAIASVLKRYYAAAAREDGESACRLMDPLFRRLVPTSYSHSGGAGANYRGRTCATVMAQVFRENHAKLTSIPEVLEALVKGSYAYAVVGSDSLTPHYLSMHRHHGTWTVEDALGAPFS
jgi:hypothetical protein